LGAWKTQATVSWIPSSRCAEDMTCCFLSSWLCTKQILMPDKKWTLVFYKNPPKSLCFQWVHMPQYDFPNSVIPSEFFSHKRIYLKMHAMEIYSILAYSFYVATSIKTLLEWCFWHELICFCQIENMETNV
jgi:hypothetical protein